jgi:hypothetical protein
MICRDYRVAIRPSAKLLSRLEPISYRQSPATKTMRGRIGNGAIKLRGNRLTVVNNGPLAVLAIVLNNRCHLRRFGFSLFDHGRIPVPI